MNKQDFAMTGILITAVTMVTGIVSDNISGISTDLSNHKEIPCHSVTCEKIDNLEKLLNEQHCINVKQIKQENPLDCLEE